MKGGDTSIFEAVGKLEVFVNKQPKPQKLITKIFFYTFKIITFKKNFKFYMKTFNLQDLGVYYCGIRL